MKQTLSLLALAGAALQVLAHGGHGGTEPSHWHASDLWGLAVAALAAAALWAARRQ